MFSLMPISWTEILFFEGYELRNPRVDTVELAQVFFPELEKYSLPILCRELGIPLNMLTQPFQMPKLQRNYFFFYEKRWPNFLKVSWKACWKWLTPSYTSPTWLLMKFFETNLSLVLQTWFEVQRIVFQEK